MRKDTVRHICRQVGTKENGSEQSLDCSYYTGSKDSTLPIWQGDFSDKKENNE